MKLSDYEILEDMGDGVYLTLDVLQSPKLLKTHGIHYPTQIFKDLSDVVVNSSLLIPENFFLDVLYGEEVLVEISSYCDGVHLSLRRDYPTEFIKDVFSNLGMLIQELHQAGFAHGDFHLLNFKVAKDSSHVYLFDFESVNRNGFYYDLLNLNDLFAKFVRNNGFHNDVILDQISACINVEKDISVFLEGIDLID